jgi:hypothetical protein
MILQRLCLITCLSSFGNQNCLRFQFFVLLYQLLKSHNQTNRSTVEFLLFVFRTHKSHRVSQSRFGQLPPIPEPRKDPRPDLASSLINDVSNSISNARVGFTFSKNHSRPLMCPVSTAQSQMRQTEAMLQLHQVPCRMYPKHRHCP